MTDMQVTMLRAQSKQWETLGKIGATNSEMMIAAVGTVAPDLAKAMRKLGSGNAAYLGAKNVTASTVAGVAGVTGRDPADVSSALREENFITAWSSSPSAEFVMRWIGSIYPTRGELYTEHNGKLLVRASAKSEAPLEETNWKTLRAMFERPYGKNHDWPHLVLTANHAYADQVSDMTDLIQGAEALVKHAFPPERLPNKPRILYGTKPADPKNGIMVAGVSQTRRNAYLNGADLIERLSYRKQELKASEKDAEHAVRTVKNPSFAARRLAKTILILLSENPQALDPDEPLVLPSDRDIKGQEPEITEALRKSNIKSGASIQLRPDAAEVARHLKLFGYSLGANTVSDAMRLVVRELTAKIPGKSEGRFTIATNSEEAAMPIVGGEIGDKKFMVSDIVKRIGVLTVAPGEIPMSQAHKDWGIRRINLINSKDNIASHFWNGTPQWKNPYVLHDNLLKFDGDFANLGHAPKSALGTSETPGLLYGKKSEAAKNPIVDRLQGFWAPVLGKAAIADIRFKNLDAQPAIVIEPSVGTNQDFLDERAAQIETALSAAMSAASDKLRAKYGTLKVVHHHDRGEFEVVPTGGNVTDATQMAKDRGAVNVVQAAMRSLKDDANNGLFISNVVFEDIKEYSRNMSSQGVA